MEHRRRRSSGLTPGSGRPYRFPRAGFTLLEILFVLMIVVVTMAVASHTYASYLERTVSERAAKIFARDLSLARTSAIQERESVVVRFTTSERRYAVETEGGRRIVSRTYDDDAEAVLSEMGIDLPGDSVVFDGRGIADLSGVDGSVGTATFRAGGSTHTVSFNGMGTSKVESS